MLLLLLKSVYLIFISPSLSSIITPHCEARIMAIYVCYHPLPPSSPLTIIYYIPQNGWTAMMCAACKGYKEIVSLLVERGANMDVQNVVRLYHPLPHSSPLTIILYSPIHQYGRTAMMEAAFQGHLEIVSLLVERGANMDLQAVVRLYHPLPLSSPLTIILYSPVWWYSHDECSHVRL